MGIGFILPLDALPSTFFGMPCNSRKRCNCFKKLKTRDSLNMLSKHCIATKEACNHNYLDSCPRLYQSLTLAAANKAVKMFSPLSEQTMKCFVCSSFTVCLSAAFNNVEQNRIPLLCSFMQLHYICRRQSCPHLLYIVFCASFIESTSSITLGFNSLVFSESKFKQRRVYWHIGAIYRESNEVLVKEW